ncbi:MAG: hypothetical protein R3E68_21140 [Burkholderiaceae bacterium]
MAGRIEGLEDLTGQAEVAPSASEVTRSAATGTISPNSWRACGSP